MHLAERIELLDGYVARRYRGPSDHVAMAEVLGRSHEQVEGTELPTVEQLDVAYEHMHDCDPDTDIALVEHDGHVVAYSRASWVDLGNSGRDCIVFTPTVPEHLGESLFVALLTANEQHMRAWADASPPARYRAYASRDRVDGPPSGEALWLEHMGYTATQWGAALVRPHLNDIPIRVLPHGVEVRPVTEAQVRPILEAHWEAFRAEWDFREATDSDFIESMEHAFRDESLWKVAWAGDTIVGQVKPYINTGENTRRGHLRGYTEFISTHRDWRNRGIAGALLAMSLQELKDRGMTEAALGVDSNNPGGAFQLYTSLGFQVRSYEAVYTKPVD
ncbi:MAG TPA: GNAT family N-acetyltransferase [Ilumatobacteraceae bacterium]|nr:GNAT family N-acetyltransferase [Ilumatobacteraceae bacterium]